ncbi:hypothetical protein [Amnibacterium setariae]|uniref:Histidine kinase n=1 Tax=Amnibacterium setariae TaxID=2306585 RepID=A0A3A1TWP7_9MICO|nr:hypothetical protein [Amnibacterium setariae]RIX26568.1 hypothetical protein D1781_16745 [Amnibacterium setariae]
MIPLPRVLLALLAAGVAACTITNGVLSLPEARHPVRVEVAIGLYVVAFVLTMLDRRPILNGLLSGLNAGVCFAMALLCASGLESDRTAGDEHWYIAAAGCLLVLTMVRRRPAHAWIGTALVAAQTLLWAGPEGVLDLGVATMALWVAAAYFGIRSLSHAMRDIQQFARSEREAVEWQAAQDAHHFERQVRLTQTSRVAMPMLRHIADVDGDLDEDAKQECRVLEQTIRDEIRGRRLLNEALRDQVIEHRRRGAFVQVLDDGGLDDVDPELMEPILDEVAAKLAQVRSDRIIIRTAPRGSDKSVTVVAITIDETAAALGLEDEGEEVDLWLELPRPIPAGV